MKLNLQDQKADSGLFTRAQERAKSRLRGSEAGHETQLRAAFTMACEIFDSMKWELKSLDRRFRVSEPVAAEGEEVEFLKFTVHTSQFHVIDIIMRPTWRCFPVTYGVEVNLVWIGINHGQSATGFWFPFNQKENELRSVYDSLLNTLIERIVTFL